jgi:hypothetical protein
MMNRSKAHLATLGAALVFAAFLAIGGSPHTSHADSRADTPRLVAPGTAKAYALALPPEGSASGGNAGLGFASAKAMRAKGQLPSYVQAMLEPAELGDLANDEVTGATTKPGSKAFQSCVARKLIAINFPKFAAPRMGAEYTFSFE